MVSSVQVQLQLRDQVVQDKLVPNTHRLTARAVQFVIVGRSMLYNMLTKNYNMQLVTCYVTVIYVGGPSVATF